MVRIYGVDVPYKKIILIALTYIYGIGISKAKLICNLSNINFYIKMSELNEKQLELVRNNVKNLTLEGDLRREVMLNIKRLMDINCYRGLRHKKGLPVRGQRTKTNSKTCKKLRKNFK